MSSVAVQLDHVFPTLTAGRPPQRRVESSLRRLEALAWFMDEALPIPGTRFAIGADVILGLAPVIGSLIAGVVQLYVLVEALRLGIPRITAAKIVGNVVVDSALGSIPLVGTVFDMFFKASRRNVNLLLDGVTAPR